VPKIGTVPFTRKIPVERLVIATLGSESESAAAYVSPSSVPESYAYRSMLLVSTQLLFSQRSKFETPTNQSGLGAIIETKVTFEKSGVISKFTLTDPGEVLIPSPDNRFSAVPAAIADVTSSLKSVLLPVSAMLSIPVDAIAPDSHKVTFPLWVAPINPEKCGFEGKSIGCVTSLQTLSKVTVYKGHYLST
jgi:hypothetical protein